MLSEAPLTALYAGVFTWFITLLGGATVFGVRKISNKIFAFSPEEEREGIKKELEVASLLTLAITLHNFPEGMAIAMPLRSRGESRLKSFFYALSFAAGAMVFVVIEEFIPESERTGYHDIASISAIFGFVIMLILDVAFG